MEKLEEIIKAYLEKAYKLFGLLDERFFKMSFLKMFNFVNLRNSRVADLDSEEVLSSIKLKEKFFPLQTPYCVLCVDGRILQKLIACLHGKAFTVPAGDAKSDFLPKRNKEELFLADGPFSEMLQEAYQKQNGVINIILDSHLHCAAGKISAEDHHCGEVSDEGLFDDVVKKAKMKQAILEYCRRELPDAKVSIFQIAFNPEDGYLFAGLEKCLNSGDFTKETINNLAEKNLLISTAKASENFEELFQNNFFECDYRSDYRNSTLNFWKNFEKMSEKLLPFFEKEVKEILSFSDEKEIKQFATVLAANCYNGYLHNHQADGSKKDYPYSVHKESVITVTFSEKGPFERVESFFVYPGNKMILDGIGLGRNLIIKNRAKNNMSSLEIEMVKKIFGENIGDYQKAPVPAIFFQRTAKEISEEEKKKLQGLDWTDLADQSWYYWSDEEMFSYLQSKWSNIPLNIGNAINSLRKMAISIYEPGQSATSYLLNGSIIPFWFLSGPDREIIIPLPFLMNGY